MPAASHARHSVMLRPFSSPGTVSNPRWLWASENLSLFTIVRIGERFKMKPAANFGLQSTPVVANRYTIVRLTQETRHIICELIKRNVLASLWCETAQAESVGRTAVRKCACLAVMWNGASRESWHNSCEKMCLPRRDVKRLKQRALAEQLWENVLASPWCETVQAERVGITAVRNVTITLFVLSVCPSIRITRLPMERVLRNGVMGSIFWKKSCKFQILKSD